MNEVIDFVQNNWALFGGAAIILAPNIWALLKNKVGPLLSKLKSGNTSVVQSAETTDKLGIIVKDLECLQWLANRGIDENSEELVTELENVNSKLYRIHRDMYKSTISPVSK